MELSTIERNLDNQCQQNHNSLMGSDLVDVNVVAEPKSENSTTNAKQFLDSMFPLTRGSHQDVCSYVVYYQHLLMFFADGSHTGLRDTRQFVALSGHKSEPSAILLQDKGTHVGLSFDRKGAVGAMDRASIEDIQLEGHRYWISLLNVQQQNVIQDSFQDRVFTAKDGSDYLVKS